MKDAAEGKANMGNELQRRLSRKAFGFMVVVALLLLAAGQKSMAKGLALGAFFSVLNFAVVAQILPLKATLKNRKSAWLAFFSIAVRAGFLAFPLIIALKMETFHWVAVAAGLLGVPLAIFLNHGIVQRLYPGKAHS